MIDLRSDTVTKPTAAMMERMARAELGDDGRGDDPTVKRLEEMAADRMGKERGLFVPSGTMGNLLAILAHTERAGEVAAELASHIFRSEMGGLSALAGLFPRGLPGERGAMDIEALREVLAPPSMRPHSLGTALVCLETTHNAAGGTVLPLTHIAEVRRLTAQHGIPLHLDGARIFNAAVATNVDARQIASHVDSVTFCVSKGLSAPVGSVLTGTERFINRARGFRRMLGGNMRQAGLLAACGIVALEQNVERLREDHVNARALAEGLHALNPNFVNPSEVETNIVMFRVPGPETAADWVKGLSAFDILTAPAGRKVIRLVTHRHVGRAEVDQAIAAFAAISGNGARKN